MGRVWSLPVVDAAAVLLVFITDTLLACTVLFLAPPRCSLVTAWLRLFLASCVCQCLRQHVGALATLWLELAPDLGQRWAQSADGLYGLGKPVLARAFGGESISILL